MANPADYDLTHVPADARDLVIDWLEALDDDCYDLINVCDAGDRCGVWLTDGSDIQCYAVAHDPDFGSWWVLRRDGFATQYLAGEVY